MNKVFLHSLIACMLVCTPALTADKKSKPLFRIPFEQVGSYIVLKTSINKSKRINLLLDTGIGQTLITELDSDDSIQLHLTSRTKLMGLGAGSDLEALVSADNEFQIGKLQLNNQFVVVLDNDIFKLSQVTGYPINGIMGSTLFENHIVEINFQRQKLLFYPQENFTAPDGYRRISMTMDGTKMYVDVLIQDANNRVRTVRMLVDTGAELVAWFRSQGNDPLPLPDKRIPAIVGKGLNGNIVGDYGRMSTIELAGFTLHQAVVAFPDSASIAHTLGQSNRNGTIGAQLLNRFNLIIDQKTKSLYLRPNRNFDKPFRYNLTGMEATKDAQVLSLPEIYHVRKGSPADLAGVKETDLIFEINGINGFKISLQEIKHILETPSGKIWLTLIRNGKTIRVNFAKESIL